LKRLFLAFLLPVLLPAQNVSCSLAGTVQDSAGAVIPSAKVTLTGQENGFVRTVTTNHEGFFSYPDLTPATFTISVEAPGFKVYKQTGILINADEQRSLGQIKLQVGQVSESVTITADAVTVNTSNGERAGTLSGEQLDEIALRGRDIFDAVSLMPGVVDTSDGRDAPSPNSISNIYIMGGRNDSKNMTIDGVTNLDTGSNTTVHSMPSMDSVAEVKVLMSAYSAENGRNPSSINVITKGGGTQIHGQVAWYFRNEDLNANNFFSNSAGHPRQEYRYNIGSYFIGGPVVLPKIYRHRNNLFFFFNQEFQNQVVSYAVNEKTVPTPLERIGDYSQSVNTNGTKINITDPTTGKQFPGNIIPASRINPVGQAILNMFPSPNFVDPNLAFRYNWNYYVAASEPYSRRTETARLDFAPRQNWQLYLSLSNNADHQNVPYSGGVAGWVAGSLNFVMSPIHFEQPGRLATLHSTNTITPTLFNEASFAVSQNTLTFEPELPQLVNRTALGINIPQRNPSLNPQNLIPDMTFNVQNYANPSMNDGTPYFNQNTIYSLVDNISKVYGSHVFKTGIYFERTAKIQSASPPVRGTINFSTDANNPTYNTNDSYANALLGYYDSYQEALSRPQSNYVFTNTEWFFQDDWKMKSNLSISWGVRFYHDPPQYDTRGLISSFSPQAWNPAQAPVLIRPAVVNSQNVGIDPTTGTLYALGQIGLFVPGVGNTADGMLVGGKNGVPGGLFSTAPIAVGPRFGFAWDPFKDGKTAIRGGGGIYFDRIEGNPVMNLSSNPPAVYSPVNYYGSFADIAAAASSGFLSPSTVYSVSSTPHQQQVYNFNMSVERRIGSNIFSAGYTGSLGRHLLDQRNINAVPPGASFYQTINPQNKNPQSASALSTNFLRPYSAYGDIDLREFASNSNYHALLMSFQHRLSHGLNLGGSYTWSKALDVSDAYSQAVDPFLPARSRNYGPAYFNRAHVFTANFLYILPKPGKMTRFKPLGWVSDNWQLSGVVRMLTGAPITPGYSLITGINAPTGTPSDNSTTGTPPGIRMEVLNPNAPLSVRFAPPPEPAGQASVANAGPWLSASPLPQFGNLGQNTLTGPGTNNWDLSLYRVIPFNERVKSMLRIETYNTFNHTQFSAINSTAQFNTQMQQVNTAFLLPTSARPARLIQLALRVTF
jgi:hypothetical protein